MSLDEVGILEDELPDEVAYGDTQNNLTVLSPQHLPCLWTPMGDPEMRLLPYCLML